MTKFKVYRHFNETGELLYVGSSISVFNRLSGHASTAKWFDEITSIEIENFNSNSEMLDAERKAIIDEKPLLNIMGNPNAVRKIIHWRNGKPLKKHNFIHFENGKVRCTTVELSKTYDLNISPVCSLVAGRLKNHKGWRIEI